jgi:acetolactate synthase-1/2/3 large subunit
MKLSDYVIEFCQEHVGHIFLVTGGGAMHLDDSIGKYNMDVSMQHEQAAAIAAEAYARFAGFGVCCVTTGPGGTNALTGVAGAWLDSTPMLVLSGQVKRADMINGQGVRQSGLQELPIVDLAKHVTKYAACVTEPNTIRYHLERAYYEATSGRRGPVWLDIPLDVQSAEINPNKLIAFEVPEIDEPTLKNEVHKFIELYNDAKRPVLLIGNGARQESIEEFIELLRIPVLSTWNAKDIYTGHLYVGSPGAVAERGAVLAHGLTRLSQVMIKVYSARMRCW